METLGKKGRNIVSCDDAGFLIAMLLLLYV